MNGDRLIRVSTALVVVAVAAFAAVVSYSHIYDLGRVHGQFGLAGRLLPLSIDGTILAASLVMLHEARHQRPAPGLARFTLGLGVAATVCTNVAYGAGFGSLGAVLSAVPAMFFILCVELLMLLIRRRGGQAAGRPAAQIGPGVPADAEAAARVAFAASVAARNPLSHRQVAERFALSRSAAARVRQSVLAEANGQPAGTADR